MNVAVELYQKLANQGHAFAQYALGKCYKNGIGLEKDNQKAIEKYQDAAKQGLSKAQYTALASFIKAGL